MNRQRQEWINVFNCVPIEGLVEIILYHFVNRDVLEYGLPNVSFKLGDNYFLHLPMLPAKWIDLEYHVTQYRHFSCYWASRHNGRPITDVTLLKLDAGSMLCTLRLKFVDDATIYEFKNYNPTIDNLQLLIILRTNLTQSTNVVKHIPIYPITTPRPKRLVGTHNYRDDCYWCGKSSFSREPSTYARVAQVCTNCRFYLLYTS